MPKRNWNPTIPRRLLKAIRKDPQRLVGTCWSRHASLLDSSYLTVTSVGDTVGLTAHNLKILQVGLDEVIGSLSIMVYEGMDISWAAPGCLVVLTWRGRSPRADLICLVERWGTYRPLASCDDLDQPVFGHLQNRRQLQDFVRRPTREERQSRGVRLARMCLTASQHGAASHLPGAEQQLGRRSPPPYRPPPDIQIPTTFIPSDVTRTFTTRVEVILDELELPQRAKTRLDRLLDEEGDQP